MGADWLKSYGLSRAVRVMRVKHKRGIKRDIFPGDSKRVVPRIMLDPSRNVRDHVPGLFIYKNVEQIRPVQKRRTNHGIFNRSSEERDIRNQ